MALNHVAPVTRRQSSKFNEHLTIAFLSAFILCVAWISSATTENVQLFGIRLPALCGFKLLTTWDCPGCGLTRSLILALHGDFLGSYFMHIWGIPLMLILLFQIPYRILRYAKPGVFARKLPSNVNKWISPAIFLSIILPWIFKTIALGVIRYL